MFKIGDKVRKIKGYPFSGKIVSVYADEDKCVVKHKDKWEHIFSSNQLTLDYEEYQYLDLLSEILEQGEYREGRNGGTYSLFGKQLRFNLSDGIPLLTTKKIHFKSVVGELLWMLRGDTNTKYLKDNGISIWDEWADENGDLGPVYGQQWRNFDYFRKSNCGIDQILNVIESIKKDPFSRRHIVSAWNPILLDDMALPPCHTMFQFYVSQDRKLSCQLYQRSGDAPIGIPFNIASYSLLTQLIAKETGLKVGEFIHTFGDVHIYANQVEGVTEQLSRMPFPKPYTQIDSNKSIFDLDISDIKLMHYNSHPTITFPVST